MTRCTRFAWLPFVVACATAPVPAPPAAPPVDSRWAALAHDVPRLLADAHVASASIARIEHGEIVWTGAFGEQRPGVAATPETLYNIASLAKPISAEVVLRLAASGQLALDEPMAPVWVDPDLSDDPRHKLLTPRLALSHRTGLPNWRRETGGVLAFRQPPGEAFGYSGEGFEYVARFVEHKVNLPFETLAQTLVLDPAGMKETSYTHRDWFTGRVATPTDASGARLEPIFATSPIASDLVYATARDYARFLISVLHHDGLTADLAAERQHIEVSRKATLCPAAPPACPRDIGIGLSWEVYELGDETYLLHTGKDQGVFTFAYVNLNTRSGTVIFTNSDNGAALVLPILDRLAADARFVAMLRKLDG